jgi:hypothetical protein
MEALVSISKTIRLPGRTCPAGVGREKKGREKANASRHNIMHRKTRSGMFCRRLRLVNRGSVVRRNISELNVTRLRV